MLFLVLFLLSGCVKETPVAKHDLLEFETVERVVDGDTLVLGNGERVRLIGINAPEKGEPCFGEAKKALQEMVENKQVFLQKDEVRKTCP